MNSAGHPGSAPVRTRVRTGMYQDSVNLMLLAAALEELPGVERAAAVMGSTASKALLAEAGLLTPDLSAATPNDLCLAIRASNDQAFTAAEALADSFLRDGYHRGRSRGEAAPAVRSIERALALQPGANLAVISVPGSFAAREARQALGLGLHVFLFSDNVALADEVALKREAEQRGLLLMGPDCGTAILGGVALGFANRVPGGSIGVVGGSGTGIQEVTCLLARLGSGVSHAIGTGSHDLTAEVGGSTSRLALRALMEDPSTEQVVWVSKPGDPGVTADLLTEFGSGTPRRLVAMLLGLENRAEWARRFPRVCFADTLEEAAFEAAGRSLPVREPPAVLGKPGGPRGVRGIFAGGTLASEAARLLGDEPDVRIVDYGDDAYTRGRPHPMIDSTRRVEAIRDAGTDASVGLLLLDVVLGYGAHADPAGSLLPALNQVREQRPEMLVITTLVGTEQDPQGYGAQRARLEGGGVLVADSTAEAARWVGAWRERPRP